MKFFVDAGLMNKDFLSLPLKSYLKIMPLQQRSDIIDYLLL